MRADDDATLCEPAMTAGQPWRRRSAFGPAVLVALGMSVAVIVAVLASSMTPDEARKARQAPELGHPVLVVSEGARSGVFSVPTLGVSESASGVAGVRPADGGPLREVEIVGRRAGVVSIRGEGLYDGLRVLAAPYGSTETAP